MKKAINKNRLKTLPQVPFEGTIDITYRCNNGCPHCGLLKEKCLPEEELTFNEIREIVDRASEMGCQNWAISGGEPMVRDDFPEIFDYITGKSITYTLNTNGTLITKEIAGLMKRLGDKIISLYGATEEVHDSITGTPGSFDGMMRGLAYLSERGASFILQIVPMEENYHQLNEIEELAKSLSPYYRTGSGWLYLSACREPVKNGESEEKSNIMLIDKSDLEQGNGKNYFKRENNYFFSSSVARRDFHIDPIGQMSFCRYVKNSDLRYDIRKGSFKNGWENFIPSCSQKFKINKEYREICHLCELSEHCRWFSNYCFQEDSSKVFYLYKIIDEIGRFKKKYKNEQRQYFELGPFTLQIDSDLPFNESTFHRKFNKFRIEKPEKDIINLKHHFFLPELNEEDSGKKVYSTPPWKIYRKNSSWIYISMAGKSKAPTKVAVFNEDYTSCEVYSPDDRFYLRGNLTSLTTLPTDQIMFSQVMAHRNGFYINSSAAVADGKGMLFAGHSSGIKSGVTELLSDRVTILSDDRNIIRKSLSGFEVYSTWSHDERATFFPGRADLKGIYFLKNADYNKAVLIEDRKRALKKILSYIIKPFFTADWWNKILPILEDLCEAVPCYDLYFDKNGGILPIIEDLNKE